MLFPPLSLPANPLTRPPTYTHIHTHPHPLIPTHTPTYPHPHIQLELIPLEAHEQNPYVRYARELEQHFMEGSYGKVLRAAAQVPLPYYATFTQKLTTTVRYDSRHWEVVVVFLVDTGAIAISCILSAQVVL